jgi:hypothetical protein
MEALTPDEKLGFELENIFDIQRSEQEFINFLFSKLSVESEYYLENLYYVHEFAYWKVNEIGRSYINRINPEEEEDLLLFNKYSEEEMKNYFTKVNSLHILTDTLISKFLEDNSYFNNIKFNNTKFEEIKDFGFCFIKNDEMFWYSQAQQLGIVIYNLNEKPEFEKIGLESLIELLISSKIINLINCKWSSVRIKAFEIQSFRKEINNKLLYPFAEKINVELAVELIYVMLKIKKIIS